MGRIPQLSVTLVIVAAVAACATQDALSQEAPTGEPLPVWGLSFSPDGALLAVAAGGRGGSGVVKIWDRENWTPVITLEERRAPTATAFSPDGATLLVSTQSADVVLVDVAGGEVQRRWNTKQGAVNGVAWTPNGEQFLTAGPDGTIRVWDSASGDLLRTLDTWKADGLTMGGDRPQDPDRSPAERSLWDVAVSPDGRTVVTGGWGDTTRLWDLETGEQIQSFGGTDELVQGVAFTPDGDYFVASAQRHADVFVRETQTGAEAVVFSSASGRDVAIHPDGDLLAVASRRGPVVFRLNVKVPTDEDVEQYLEIIARFEDDDVRVREGASQEVLAIGAPIAPLLFDAIQAPGAETRMRARALWNQVRSAKPLAVMSGHDGELRQVAFSPDGNLLVTATKSGEIGIWSVPEFELQRMLTVTARQ